MVNRNKNDLTEINHTKDDILNKDIFRKNINEFVGLNDKKRNDN